MTEVPATTSARGAASDPAPSHDAEGRPLLDPDAARPIDQAPPWLMPMVRQTIWRVVWVGLGMTVLVLSLLKARGLISTLVIALFLSLAMDPAVATLTRRRGWSRGRASGVVFLGVLASVVLLITVLIPALVEVAQTIAARLPGWIASIERTFDIQIGGADRSLADELDAAVQQWLQDNGRQVLGLASSTVGVVFQMFTLATFTLYFAADAPQIRRAVLTKLPPARQARIGWAWDTAIEQTGGYFYSRLLLLVINATLYFVVMVAVGVPWLIALPLAVFQGFFAEFIPVVGTYIGAAIPILVTLGIQGAWQAVVLLVWTLVYQQIENYLLSPRISARTMEINGGVAFGAALAGGAIAGPMGAFMAMPIAALVTSFVKHYVPRYPLVYRSARDGLVDAPAAELAGRPAAEVSAAG
ncbi:MAG: AI-2E family transporter [Candidatus Nanopelagicales bacterium]|nr:AI-2E family transporter [Candidatus Nanopelagicales bacterium]